MTTEQYQIGYEAGYQAGFDEALAQQEQPASVDAYVGAREDAAIWKKRALEAEELNRKFIAELNGPTYLGEPAQPAQEPVLGMTVTALAGEIIEALLADEKDGGYDLTAGLFGANFSTLVRRWARAEWAAPPTQPALSDEDIAKFVDQEAGLPDLVGMKDMHPAYRRFGRAIEARCRGGNHGWHGMPLLWRRSNRLS